MEAPDKIYLHIRANNEIGSTWRGDKITNNDIEYTRTDAFIEKAAEWMKLYVLKHDMIDIFEMEDNFKKI